MKLGKKVLSCILAIMMIVTSISVCFNTFAASAESQLKNLYNQINMDYDGLMQAIKNYEANPTDDDAKKQVPSLVSGANWTVARDTYHSGWYNVSKAFASYAKAVTAKTDNGINSYTDVVNAALTGLDEIGNYSGATKAEVTKVLSFFKFGTTGSLAGVGMGRTLTIKAGIDFFAWSSIGDIETNRNYYEGKLAFTIETKENASNVYGIKPDNVTFTTTADQTEDINTKLGNIKSVLMSMVDEKAFRDWFTWNFAEKSVEEIQTLVDGENSAANLLKAFTDGAALAGFTDKGEALWDYYVKDIVGKDFKATQKWIDTDLMSAIFQAYGSSYRQEFNDLMAVKYHSKTKEEILEHYNKVIAVENRLLDQRDPTQPDVVIFDDIRPWLNGEDNFYDVTVTNYIKALKVDVARAYAAAYADELAELLAKELPTYNKDDAEAAEKWKTSPERDQVVDFIGDAVDLKGRIDTYVLGFGTYEDIKESFSANGKRITEADYNSLLKKIENAKIDANGFEEFANKAKMDSFIASTIFGGRSYTVLTTLYYEFKSYYKNAEDLKNDATNQTLYEKVYGEEGIDEYADYLASIKYAVVERIYEQVDRIEKYYKKAGKVTFYNFEAIIAAYDALEVVESSLKAFLNEAPAYKPASGQPTLSNISSLYEKALGYYNDANSFKTGLNTLKNAANGSDINIMKYISSGGSGNSTADQYKWVSSVNKLNVDRIIELVNKVGLVNKTVSTAANITDLMNGAVSDLDKILVSNDLGTVLDKLLVTTDEETGETKGFLGQWKQTYTLDGVKHNKGTDIKNLREFLVNLIIDLLYNGNLLNMIMEKLYPILGELFYKNLGKLEDTATFPSNGEGIMPNVDASIVGYIYFEALGTVLSALIPNLPQHFIWGTGTTYSKYGNVGADSKIQYYKLFTGDLNSNMKYPNVLKAIGNAQIFNNNDISNGQTTEGNIVLSVYTQGASEAPTSYWSPIEVPRRRTATSTLLWSDHWYYAAAHSITEANSPNWSIMDEDPQATWKLNADNPNTLYYALAAALGGLGSVLKVLLTGESQEVTASINVLGLINNPTITATFNGDNLYARLIEPLYQVLGITNYHTLQEIKNVCTVSSHGNINLFSNNGGATLFQYILEPILNWMNTTLFEKPVETILGILPNLLAAVEHNQILPKLKNLNLKINALGSILTLNLNVWELKLTGEGILGSVNVTFIEGINNLGELLSKQLGIPLDQGINGLANGLLSFTATKTPQAAGEKGVLMAFDKTANDGAGGPSETEVATYKDKNGTPYYFKDCGVLTQTIYNLLGDGFIEWMLTTRSGGKTTFNIKEGAKASLPLKLPVNRFLAAGKTMTTWKDDGGNTHYKLNVDKGTVLLELLRWLMDDGSWYDIKGLIEPILAPADGEAAEGPSILDTISAIIDGQADYISAVLICLLNEYGIDYTSYVDSAANYKNGTGTFADENGNPYIVKKDGKWVSNFVLGTELSKTLEASGDPENPNLTDGMKYAKADLAVENLDKVITSLFPIIVSVLGDALEGTLAKQLEQLHFKEVATKVKTGQLTTLSQILGEIFISNNFVNLFMGLLIGTHEMVDVKDENGEVVKDDDGNPVQKLDTGLLGGLLGDTSGIISRVLQILSDFGLDITPYGFYQNSLSGVGRDINIQSWLINEAVKFRTANPDKYTSTTAVTTVLKDMTWADVGFTDGQTWFNSKGFDTLANTRETYANFLTFLEHFIAALNPVLCLLLTGEDITLLDRLTLQGNEGYSRAIVPLLEAFGLDSACMTQAAYNRLVYTGSQTGTNNTVLDAANGYAVKSKGIGSARFYEEKVSPLHPIFDALTTLLVGNGKEGDEKKLGLLDAPVSVLAENLPNIAYMLYMYTTKDDDGNDVRTNNLSVALQNLIAPVLKLLEIADPIIARLIKLDISGLLNKYLDLETLLNEMLSNLLDSDKDAPGYEFSKMLDFGEIAAKSADEIKFDANTYRNGFSTFTKFVASPGKLLITLLRSVLNPDLVNMLGEVVGNLFFQAGITTAEDVQSQERILKIVKNITANLNQMAADGTYKVDIVIGIIIDLLSDYNPDEGAEYFYNKLNKSNSELEEAIEQYGIEHKGYDWKTYANKFDYSSADKAEESVNSAIANIDYVIQQAVPDVFAALVEEGVLNLPIDFEIKQENGLWEFVETIVNSALFNDDIVNMVINLVLGLLGQGDADNKTMELVLSVIKSAGFDVTPSAYIFNKDGTQKTSSSLYGFITYGIDKKDGIADIYTKGATVFAKIGGVEKELTWHQIYLNHSFQGSPAKDEDGNAVKDNDGNIVYTRSMIASGYPRVMEDGKYVYTYTNAKGEEVNYTSEIPDLTELTLKDGEEDVTYKLSIKYNKEATPAWSWGLDSISTGAISSDFAAKKSRFIDVIWDMLAPFAKVFSTLIAGDSLKLFNDGLTLRGNKAYENVIIPLLNAFGLDAILDYVNTATYSDTGKTILETINSDGRGDAEKIKSQLMTADEYYGLVYPSGGEFSPTGMRDAIKVFADYLFYFIEILLTCPVSTLATALPTLAYFIWGDGLTTLIANILIPVTTLTNRLQEIVAIDVNGIGGGLLDMVATGSWETFQEALASFVEIDEETGEIITHTEGQSKAFTKSLMKLLCGLELDLSGILAPKDEVLSDKDKENYKYSLIFFLDKNKEVEAHEIMKQAKVALEEAEEAKKDENKTLADAKTQEAKDLKAQATEIRVQVLNDFLKSIAALGDEIGGLGKYKSYVKITDKGQVTVSKAEVLMWLLTFVTENTAIIDVLDGIGIDPIDLGGVLTLDVKEVINNVLQNPDVLVDVIVGLVTTYKVNAQKEVELIEIETETHEDFYEEMGYNSLEEVLAELEKHPDKEINQLSRVQTTAAIDNLDALVGTILNILKQQLAGEGGFLASLGFTTADNLTLKGIVDKLLENYAYNDEMINKLVSMLIGALGSDSSKQIVNIIFSIVEGAGYSLTPQTIKKNLPQLASVIGDAKKWNQVAKANEKYVYEYKEEGKDAVTLYADAAGLTTIDGKEVKAVMVQAVDKDGKPVFEDEEQKVPVYTDVQQKAVNITGIEWHITNRDELVSTIWNLIKPLTSIFETLLTGGNLTIYEKVKIRGLEGYKGVILPIEDAFAVSKLTRKDGTPYLENYYATYEEFYNAVYNADGTLKNSELLLKSITDILFAVVDSLCERPISTLLTALPYLARFIESNGIDIVLENLIAPITTILDKIRVIYDLDVIGIVKNLLVNLIEGINKNEGVSTTSLEPEDQDIATAALAAYVLDMIEDNEPANRPVLANVLNAELLAVGDAEPTENSMTFVDILWKFIYSFEVNGISLAGLVPDTIFTDIATCVWLPGSVKPIVEIAPDGKSGQITGSTEVTELTVDRETVLIKFLNWVVFTPGIRDLIGSIANIDFDEKLKDADKDNKDLVATLIYSVFSSPQATEKLVIALLSWYTVQYKPVRTLDKDYSDIVTTPIDYEAAGIDKAQLDKLPSDLDKLISGVAPAVVQLLPEGLLGSIKLEGDSLENIVKNLVIGFVVDSKDSEGLATKLMGLLVNLAGGNPTVGMVLSILGEVIKGVDLSLAYFKSTSPDIAEYFKDCETWEDAYKAHATYVPFDSNAEYKDAEGNVYTPLYDENGIYTITQVPVMETLEDGTEKQKVDEEGNPVFKDEKVYEKQVVLADANSFGIETYEETLAFISSLLTPLAPVLKVLLSEKDLVALDGIKVSAGDGYDRFLIPLLEVLGVKNIMDKDEFNNLENAAYAEKIVSYIDAIIGRVLESPVEFVVDLIPQLVFFIYSDGLRQAVEQFVAPLITLVDLVNDVTAKRFHYKDNPNELYAIDIYELVVGLINGNETMANLIGEVKDIYDLIDKFLSVEGLENILAKLMDGIKNEAGEKVEIDLGFPINGVFKMIIEKCCTITDVETARHFGATAGKGGVRTVKGIKIDRANTLIGIISEIVLGGDLLKNLLGALGVTVDDTVGSILDAVTGENKYVIFQILLKYFNEYDVETMILEYLSFEKIDYIYSEYLDGTVLSQRKIRRAIKKLDASINSAIPGLIPMLADLIKDNETFENLLATLASKNVQSLKDVVDELLLHFAFKDSLVDDLVGKLVGLLGGDDIAGTLATVLPIVENLIGIDITPAAFVRTDGGALSANIAAAINAAPKFVKDEEGNDTETPYVATWSDVAKYFADENTVLTWGIDEIVLDKDNNDLNTEEKVFNAKKAAFVAIVADLLIPLEGVLNILLRGEDLKVIADEDGNNAAITIKGNDGYGNALYELFRILLNADDFAKVVTPAAYQAAKGTNVTVSALTDAIFMFVDELCEGPFEYILTLLPKLSYALSNNGIQVIITNLLSPVLAIYNLAEPVLGTLVEDLIGGAIGNTLHNFMPAGTGVEKTRTVEKDITEEVIDEETGEKTTVVVGKENVEETYWVYSIEEITGIAGEDGSNIINVLNGLLSGLLVKDAEGGEHNVIELLKPTFFTDYAHHTITVNKAKSDAKWYYWYSKDGELVKVAADDYNYKTMGEIVDQRYVVDGYNVDVADSLIFLLSTVLSEDIIYAVAGLIEGVDLNDSDNMIGVLLKNLAKGEVSAYVLADIIVKIFEGYEVKYPVHHDKQIEIDHSAYNTLTDYQKEKVDELPTKLDTVIKEAIPALMPMLVDLLAPKAGEDGEVPEPSDIYKLLKDYADKAKDDASLSGLVEELLVSFALKDETVDMLIGLIVGLLGGEQVGGILSTITPLVKDIAGIDLDPKAFANGKLKAYIGSAKTWAEVWAANSVEGEDGKLVAKPFNWGVNAAATLEAKKDAFLAVLGDLLDPLFPLLQFILQGKKLSLFNANAPAYVPVEDGDKQSENTIGNGYAKITGLNAYDQILLVLVDALRGTFKLENIKTTEEFNAIDNAKDMLSYLVNDIIFALVDDLTTHPISFIANNIASLVYFLANDGVYNIVENALSIVNVLLEATDTIYEGGKGVRLEDIIAGLANFDIRMLKLQDTGSQKGLLTTINDLIAGANLDLVLTQDLLLSLAGMLGDYEVLQSYRTTADGALINNDGRLVDKDGNILKPAELEAGKGTITTITSSGTYVITGLLGFALSDEILGKLLGGAEVSELVQTLIDNLTDEAGVSKVVDVLIKLFNKYVVEYKQYKQPILDKIKFDLGDEAKHQKLNETLGDLDNLLPIIFSLIPDLGATSLKDIVYPLFVKDDIANLLVGMIAKLLSGLPQETIDMVVGYVNQLTNLKAISVAPQAFAHGKFGSKLKDYIGDAKSWAEVWTAHSHEDDNGELVADDYAWGINTPADFINLLSDMLLPLEEVLAIILRSGTISAFKEINVIGGDGYNHAIIPLLELLGIMDAKTQAEFNEEAAKNGSIHYLLTKVFDRLDVILENPIDSVLEIFANLVYVIGNDGVETFVHNLIAPINDLIQVVDPILPIAIVVNLANIGTDKPIADTFIGVAHPGVKAGITVKASGKDLAALINSILSGISIGEDENGNPKYLGITLDLNWLEIAAQAAAEGENGKIKFTGSKFTGSYEYKNVVGDPGYTLVAVLKAILTEENLEAIEKLLGMEDGFGEPIDSIIDEVIENPAIIIELLESLLGAENLTYVPIQNRLVTPKRYDYSKYLILTEQNADLIAENLDKVITDVLVKAGYSSIKSLVTPLFAKSEMINTILDALIGVLGGETVNTVLETLAEFAAEKEMSIDLDFTVDAFYEKLSSLNDYKKPGAVNIRAGVDKLKGKTTWGEVELFEGTDWGFQEGDIKGFVRVLGDFLTPLNSVLELLLIGEGQTLNILDVVKLPGGNGYDYAIIPILEAFGYKAEEVLTLEQYKALVAKDPSQLLGYILERIATFADRLLDKPVDRLLEILPNVAYFISNEGIFLAVRNLIAPLYSIVEIVTQLFGIDLASFLNISKLLNSIALGDLIGEILGAKYDLRIPEIDFLKLAREGGARTEERATSRSLAANSFEKHINPHPYIEEYNYTDKYDSYAKKSTQTYVVADKGDTLTLVLTWVLEIFGDPHNREALVNWLADVFMLGEKAKAEVRYGVNTMFTICDTYGVSDIIVGALFQILGIAIVIDTSLTDGIKDVQKLLEDIFESLKSNKSCKYSSIASVMQKLTGVWTQNVGTDDEIHGAEQEAEKTLNWFQKIIQKIRDFFRKLFGKK